MPSNRRLGIVMGALFALGLACPPAMGASPAPDAGGDGKTAHATAKPFDNRRVITNHELALAGERLAYTATAEYLPLASADNGPNDAEVFVIAYTKTGDERRPVTFVFNGGPGASSAYLHLGAIGPRTIRFAADGGAPTPPAIIEDNPDTWLAFTDLVFIDPVGTGFSRALGEDEAKAHKFLSVESDLHALAETIRLWLAQENRWDRPKFLAGESYGGYRVAALAKELITGPGIAINGGIMISPVIDFGTLRDDQTALLASAFRLPPMAAAAAALGKAPGTPEQAAEQAQSFALGPYLLGIAGLDMGRLDTARALFDKVAALTGLDRAVVSRERGRIPINTFAREILRDQAKVVSLYDATVSGFDPNPGMHRRDYDPILDASRPAYTETYLHYLQSDLQVRTDRPFRLLSGEVGRAWEWPRGHMPNAASDMQEAMALAPSLRFLIEHGRTDLVTPYPGSAWIIRQIEAPANERDRITLAVHDGGHMLYMRPASRAAITTDVHALMKTTTP